MDFSLDLKTSTMPSITVLIWLLAICIVSMLFLGVMVWKSAYTLASAQNGMFCTCPEPKIKSTAKSPNRDALADYADYRPIQKQSYYGQGSN
jgi:hypothetical protein